MTDDLRNEFDRLHGRLDTIETKIDAHIMRHDITRQVLVTLAKIAGLTVSAAGVFVGVWKLFAH